MAIFKNNPPVVTDGLVYALDAANPFCTPRAGIPQIIGISYSNVSNGTNTAVTTTLPDGTTGNCTKLAEGTYASGQTIMNEGYSCPGSSTFSLFVKPDGINYIRIRDGDTTNLQVNFNLITGTITGGNNTANATIEAYPNGWFLISMTIFRGGAFGYGTRTVLSPDGTFTNHASTPGAGIFMFQRTMKTIPNNIANDIMGPNIESTLINGVSFNREVGGTFRFDGVDDYINAGNRSSFNIPRTVTMELWFKLNGFGSPWTNIFGKMNANGDSNTRCYSAFINSGRYIHLTTSDSIGQEQLDSSNFINIGVWNHWVGVIDRTNGVITHYVNGIFNRSGAVRTTDIVTNSEVLRVGYQGTSFQKYNGLVSVAKIYNKALSAQQVNQNYTALKRRFGL